MKKLSKNIIQTACLICLLAIIGAAQASAATFTVNSTGDAGDGTCDAAECTLREAIAAANASADNDVIEFDTTFFASAQTITLGGTQLSIANNGSLTINGPDAKSLTVSGNNASRVFYISPGANVTIGGLTVTKGNGTGSAGFNTCGGGIYNDNASLTLNNSAVSENSVPFGTNCNEGSGIFILYGTLNVRNSTINNNTGAAGIVLYTGTANVINSTISNNSGNWSGGLDGFGPSSTFNLTNVTVTGNTGNSGAGISANGSTFNVRNSIIANSNGLDCNSGGTVNIQNSLVEDGSCGVTSGVNGNLIDDPNLGLLADNGGSTKTHALLSGSPAINAGSDCVLTANGCGNGNAALTKDQRGGNRKFGSAVDMGAFEVQSPIYNSCDFNLLDTEYYINIPFALQISNCTDQFGNPYTPQSIDYYADYSSGISSSVSTLNNPPYTVIFNYSNTGNYTIKVFVDNVEAYSKDISVGYIPVLQNYDVNLSPSGTLYDTDDSLTITLSNFKDQFNNPYTPQSKSIEISNSTTTRFPVLIGNNTYQISPTELHTSGGPDRNWNLKTIVDGIVKNIPVIINNTPPDTTINSAPSNPSNDSSANFSFDGTDILVSNGITDIQSLSFECSLDGAAFTACASPQSYSGLSDGSHTFRVRAKDSDGAVDPTEASYTWTVDTTSPDTSISAQPSDPSNSSNAGFTFGGNDGSGSGVSGFECSLDNAAFTACASPNNYNGLSDGSHTFKVRAIDAAGNVDATPASYTWTIDTTRPNVSINQASTQDDPVTSANAVIHFTAVFSEPVSGFTDSDVSLGGTAGATTVVVTQIAPNNGTTYDVAVSGMTNAGIVTASIPANAAQDAAGNLSNASTSTDNTVTYAPNTAPTALINSPASGAIYPINSAVNFAGGFIDPDVGDLHTANWTFTSNGTSLMKAATVDETAKTANTSYTFNTAGVYLVSLTVTDKSGATSTATNVGDLQAMIVIYDPNGGFVTGGGWINSPAGAYRADPTLTGKANFGFVSKYQKGATVSTGNTEFQFKAGNLNFKSVSYEWLVIAGAKAQYKGSGTINGAGNYGFMLTATDGQQNGGGGVDRFRIKIWDKQNNDAIVYDNQFGSADGANPSTAIGGGSIVIHK
jgi:CSLREA domain-containing protein